MSERFHRNDEIIRYFENIRVIILYSSSLQQDKLISAQSCVLVAGLLSLMFINSVFYLILITVLIRFVSSESPTAWHWVTFHYTCRTTSCTSSAMPVTSSAWDRPRPHCTCSARTGSCGRSCVSSTLLRNRWKKGAWGKSALFLQLPFHDKDLREK